MSESRDRLKEELRTEEEYRYAYAEDFLNTSIATQIRVLREQRNLTQAELAEQIGTKQTGISRLENVNYSAWKTETLRKIARAFGVRLRITFEEFGTLLDDAERFSRKSLERMKFEADPAFQESIAASAPVDASPDATSALASMQKAPAQLSPVLPYGAAQQQALRDQMEDHFLDSVYRASIINFNDERRKRASARTVIHDGQQNDHGNLLPHLQAIEHRSVG